MTIHVNNRDQNYIQEDLTLQCPLVRRITKGSDYAA